MARKWLAAAVLVVLTGLVANAVAQDQKNELTGIIGRTFVSNHHVVGLAVDEVVTSGNGLTFEVNYGRRLWGSGPLSLTAEVPAAFNLDEDIHLKANLVPASYRSIFVTPSIRANLFPGTGFSPWVSVGGGFGYFGESSKLEFGGANPGKTGTTTGVLQIGAGFDVKIFGPFSLRAQVRDFRSGVPQLNVNTGSSTQHNLFAGGGLIWHF